MSHRSVSVFVPAADPTDGHGSQAPLVILRGVTNALASARSLDEIIAGARYWIAEVLVRGASMRLYTPDAAGRLRCVTEGPGTSSRGRRASARRRDCMRSARPAWVELLERAGLAVGIFPLISRGERLGVLEVEGDRRAVAENRELLQTVAEQVAIALGHLRERSSLQRDIDRMTRAVTPGQGLVGAGSPRSALLAAVRLLHEHVGGTVAGWLPAPEGGLRLSAIRGAGKRGKQELRRELSTLPARDTLGGLEEDLARRFAGLVGTDRADVVPVGDALLLLAPGTSEMVGPLQLVETLLGEVLQRLAVVAEAEARNEELDIGIAWIAHEVRSPLLGVRAAIEFLLQDHQAPANREMLRRSLAEIERLSDSAEGVLRWAVGAGELRRINVDLVEVVREAVDSSTLKPGDDRVVVAAPPELPLRADPTQLGTAISNIVRNALLYSPSGSEVRVTVGREDSRATVRVSDSGPGIADAERESIFDPFVRGAVAVRGFGLGLFIAKRVVEAHLGTIHAEPGPNGATFAVSIPIGTAGQRNARRVAGSAPPQ